MKNFSMRKARALLLLLHAGWAVSAHSIEITRPDIGLRHDFIPTLNLTTHDNHYITQQLIQGLVTDANGPLPGVTIAVKGKNEISVSGADGRFSVNAQAGDVLVFTSIGYRMKELTLGNYTQVQVVLEEDATALQEVTVNAGYYKVKDKERTGSIAKITSKDIETQPVTNVLAAMQGRMAGVNITQTTGTPGGGFELKIRGTNSLRPDGNAPLYIIDGVPYSSDAIGYTQTATLFPSVTNPLNSINPDAIESIEILKDADATAIYGSRGSNGVVLITTKKGKAGKTRVTLNASSGAGRATRFMKLMNTEQYLAMRAKAYENDGIANYPASAYDINGTWDPTRNTDWQKKLLGGTATFTTLQATVSGGSEHTQFLLGANHTTQGSIFLGDFTYRKGGVNFSMNHASDDKRFQLAVSANYNVQDNDQPAADPTNDARVLSPNAPELYDADGNLNWENNTFNGNPARFLNAEYKSRTGDLVGNATLSYRILPKLQAKGSFGYTDTQHRETKTTPSTIYNPALGITPESSSLFLTTTSRRSWIAEPQLSYDTELGKGTLNVLAGGTFQQQNSIREAQLGIGFTSNGLIYDMSSASDQRVLLNEEAEYKYQAFFGRVNYNWQQRYIVNLTARRDGSSRFGTGNRFANFGAVGAAWLFSNEGFLKDSKVLSFGKLRGSYGTTGSDQIGDYQYLDTYSSSGTQYQGVIGLQPTRIYNPDFGWETNRKLEAGLELGFFNDRLFLTAATFRNRSSNQLVGIPLPGTTGFTSMQANLDATVENSGYEFTLRTVNVNGKDLRWTSNLNLSVLKNKLVSFPGLDASTYSELYRIGQPLNIRLVYAYEGVDPDTGIYRFKDLNGDGQITFPEDRQKAVDLNPEFFGGFQNTMTYKNWTLDFLFQFVKQKNTLVSLGVPGRRANMPERFVNAWQGPGDVAPYQQYSTGVNSDVVAAQSLYDSSDAMIVDASYIRLKNIMLSYDVPLHLGSAKLKLYAEAQNLLTITDYDDGDPEFTSTGFSPPLRMVTLGTQLQF